MISNVSLLPCWRMDHFDSSFLDCLGCICIVDLVPFRFFDFHVIKSILRSLSLLGNLILQSWKEGLLEGHLRNSAWSFILNGYSDDFITKYKDRLPAFVDMVVGSNDAKKLSDLLVYSHVHILDELYSVPACASKINVPTQVIGATEDRIAGFESVRDLSKNIANSIFCEINSGHLAPFENPVQWRKLLLDFMSLEISESRAAIATDDAICL